MAFHGENRTTWKGLNEYEYLKGHLINTHIMSNVNCFSLPRHLVSPIEICFWIHLHENDLKKISNYLLSFSHNHNFVFAIMSPSDNFKNNNSITISIKHSSAINDFQRYNSNRYVFIKSECEGSVLVCAFFFIASPCFHGHRGIFLSQSLG